MKFPRASKDHVKIKSSSSDAVTPKAETPLARTRQELQKCYFGVIGLEKDPFHICYFTKHLHKIGN